MASHLSFLSIFVERQNGELCVLSIVNFSIFGLLTVHFVDISSDATRSIDADFFIGKGTREGGLASHGELSVFFCDRR